MKSLQPWEVESSEYLVRDEWITLRNDDCRTAAGVRLSPYYVLEYRDWVHVVPFTAAGEVVLIWQYRHGLGAVCCEIPGGTMDTTDVSPETAARRELREETGYECSSLELIGSYSPNPATHTNKVHFYLAEGCELIDSQSLDESEDIRVETVSVQRLIEMLDGGEFQQGFHLGSILLALRRKGLSA